VIWKALSFFANPGRHSDPLIWLAVYLALWAIFRAIRYVALGFMEKSVT
jgi:hypothetical protein